MQVIDGGLVGVEFGDRSENKLVILWEGGVALMGDRSFIEGAIGREGVLLVPGITP